MSMTTSQIKPLPASPDVQFLSVTTDAGQADIAYLQRLAASSNHPGLVWLGGFKSDMRATKATALDSWAAEAGRACLRFDYSGHGESGGAFDEGTISRWLQESLAVLRNVTQGPQILIGSSMGGWVSLLLVRELIRLGEGHRLAGLVLIAPAVDFTEELMWANLPASAKEDIETKGFWMRPTQYAPDPYPITRALIEDGRKNLLFGQDIRTHCPVHILQGMDDPDVPWPQAMKLVEHLAHDPVVLTLIKQGDHRLSRDEDLALLRQAVEGIA